MDDDGPYTKSILVTGCSTGIGRATAVRFAAKGYRVYAGVRKQADAESLRAIGPNVEPVMLDVTNPQQLAAVLSKLESELAETGLTALVNNAGIGKGAPLEFVDPDVVREIFEVNVMGPLIMTQNFLPLVRRAKGRIVTVGSIGGKVAGPINGPYSMSKFAIESFSDALRMELAEQGIHVSLIEPGPIRTPMLLSVSELVGDVVRDLPPEAVTLYGDRIRGTADYFSNMAKVALPPEAVVAAVEHAVEAEKPKTRYLVTNQAKLGAFMNWLLPDRAFDYLRLKAR